MSKLEFHPFHPGLDPAHTVMIDGHAPGFRMISHWPGHGTPAPLRHDTTTGSAFLYSELSEDRRRDLVGDFSIVTNNHFDTDGALSLYTMLRPDVAHRYKELMLRTAQAGDFGVFGGADALALDLSLMSDLAPFFPFSTPPFDEQRLGNLSKAYVQVFDRMPELLADPYALRPKWEARYEQVVADVDRVERGEGIAVTRVPQADLAVVETDRPITLQASRLAAADAFRLLLVHPGVGGNRYRFCFRGESWWDVVSVRPAPRVPLASTAERLNRAEASIAEGAPPARWWASPDHWTVPELGFGAPVTFEHAGARFDPKLEDDPASRLPIATVVAELRQAFERETPIVPSAFSESSGA